MPDLSIKSLEPKRDKLFTLALVPAVFNYQGQEPEAGHLGVLPPVSEVSEP